MGYIARVSNPKGQLTTTTENAARLLRYCIRHGHWSVFEHAYMTIEVTTSLYVATQMLRHRAFTFQQFSQRYAAVDALTDTSTNAAKATPVANNETSTNAAKATPWAQAIQLRMQDLKNRQNSTDDCPAVVAAEFQRRIAVLLEATRQLYADMVGAGIAKECARAILPQCTSTRLYMTGNCRCWIHYIQLRTDPATQAEHRAVALAVQKVFCAAFPTVAAALQWTEPDQ